VPLPPMKPSKKLPTFGASAHSQAGGLWQSLDTHGRGWESHPFGSVPRRLCGQRGGDEQPGGHDWVLCVDCVGSGAWATLRLGRSQFPAVARPDLHCAPLQVSNTPFLTMLGYEIGNGIDIGF
jgi:hypothetical protein